MISTSVVARDSLLKEAQTALSQNRIGDAVDKYKALAHTGDWRGYQGLLDVEQVAAEPWKGHVEYITFVIGQCAGMFPNPDNAAVFAKPVDFKAAYPTGFSVISAIEKMEGKFGRPRCYAPLINAAKNASYNHPYVAIEAVAKAAAKSKGSRTKRNEFVYAFAEALGVDRNTVNNLVPHFGFTPTL